MEIIPVLKKSEVCLTNSHLDTSQIGGKWALDLHFTLLLIPFSMLILPFPLVGGLGNFSLRHGHLKVHLKWVTSSTLLKRFGSGKL